LDAFAGKLGVAAPKVVPDLEAEHFGRPLYLQMAALLALHGERPTTAEGLTKALLNHEVRYWRGLLTPFGWAEPERLAAQLLALATLAGGFATPREARAYWATATASSLARYDAINVASLIQFLSWLCDRTAIDCALSDPDAIPPTIRPHRWPDLELYAAFLQACLASEEASRRDAFTRVQSAWGALTVGGKTATRDYWLCAAAWCATHAPDALDALDWQTQWQSFVTQRKGYVPWWMLEVARRLSFRWPP